MQMTKSRYGQRVVGKTVMFAVNTLMCICTAYFDVFFLFCLQNKVNSEMRSDNSNINSKIDEANKSLSLILVQLIKPNAVHPDG